MISPIAFYVFDFPVRWYGVAYFVTFIAGYAIARKNATYSGMTSNDIDRLLNSIVIGVIFGGRVGEFLFYQTFSKQVLYIWEGGMSFHGGLLGVIGAILIYSWKYKKNKWAVGDLVALSVPIGCFLGRIANYINCEVQGIAIKCPVMKEFFAKFGMVTYPVAFLEAFLEGFVLWLIVFLNRKKNLQIQGRTSALFMIYYGIFRIISEFFRNPDGVVKIGNAFVNYGQLLSLPMIMFGLYIFWTHKKTKKN